MKDAILAISAIFGIIVFGLIIVFIISFILAFPVMYLWNWLIPDLIELKQLTYWEAWGLFLLCGILFKGIPYKSND